MRLMLDTNILIDHIGRREPFYELSRRTCLLGITGVAETFISATMITDIHYLLSKDFGNIEAQRMIEEDLGFLEIVGVSSQMHLLKDGAISKTALLRSAQKRLQPTSLLQGTPKISRGRAFVH